jgi:hypothetical protein
MPPPAPLRLFAVFEGAGVQRGRVVLVEGLDFGNKKIAFGEECADVELVDGGAAAQYAARQVDAAERQVGKHGRGDVDAPLLRLDAHDAPNHEVADLGLVSRAQWLHRKELVCLVHVPGYG